MRGCVCRCVVNVCAGVYVQVRVYMCAGVCNYMIMIIFIHKKDTFQIMTKNIQQSTNLKVSVQSELKNNYNFDITNIV